MDGRRQPGDGGNGGGDSSSGDGGSGGGGCFLPLSTLGKTGPSFWVSRSAFTHVLYCTCRGSESHIGVIII